MQFMYRNADKNLIGCYLFSISDQPWKYNSILINYHNTISIAKLVHLMYKKNIKNLNKSLQKNYFIEAFDSIDF